MSAQPKANEPSMEEILASIRKIIADDQSKAPAATAVEPVAPAPAPVQAPPPAVVVATPVRPVQPQDDDILDLGSEAVSLEETSKQDIDLLFEPVNAQKTPVEEPAFVPQDEPVTAMMSVSPAAEIDMSSLLSNQASNSISSAFGSLAHTVLSQNARTVDDLVKEMLKPLLKGWLDDNLPTLVERLVRAEIERVARGGRG
jgi:uncharacterized protein